METGYTLGLLILYLLIAIAAVVVYFLPSIICKGRRNSTTIFLLNLFLGWTVVIWLICLVVALTSPDEY